MDTERGRRLRYVAHIHEAAQWNPLNIEKGREEEEGTGKQWRKWACSEYTIHMYENIPSILLLLTYTNWKCYKTIWKKLLRSTKKQR
jgi:hypothetical protein